MQEWRSYTIGLDINDQLDSICLLEINDQKHAIYTLNQADVQCSLNFSSIHYKMRPIETFNRFPILFILLSPLRFFAIPNNEHCVRPFVFLPQLLFECECDGNICVCNRARDHHRSFGLIRQLIFNETLSQCTTYKLP